MAKEFFKDLPNTSTPINSARLNGLLNGNESMGSIVVENLMCKNLFNKYSYVSGFIDYNTGEVTANDTFGASDYIPVKAGENYYQQNTDVWYSVLYDKNYNYISQINSNSFTPSQDGYMRTSFLLTNIDVVQVEKGNSASEVVPYKNFDNTYKNDVLFGFSHINSGTIYTLTNGKKFSDYRFLEFSSEKQTIIKSRETWEPFLTKRVELRWYEDIASGRTELVVEIEYVSDTEFRCIKSGYCAYDRNVCEDNPYPIIIRGII